MRLEVKSGFKADATTEAPVISAVKLASWRQSFQTQSRRLISQTKQKHFFLCFSIAL